MKKNNLFILLIIFFLIMTCSCQKNNQEEIKETEDNIINIEQTIDNSIKTSEKEEIKVENKQESKKTEKPVSDSNQTTKKESTKVESRQESKNETSKNDSTKKDENNVTNTTNNKDNESLNDSSNSSTTTNMEVEEKPKETDENDVLRKNIQNTYGVTIKYGDEIGNYRPKGLTPTQMTDKNEIKTYLNYTKNELAKYPKGFFIEMKNFGMPLTIYLVTSVPNNSFSGFTDREFMNNIRITVVKGYDFSYTLNHEIMHYIDAYLECKMYPNTPYTEYVALNPSGYNYGKAIERYNFGYNGSDKEVYFMDNYAQTNVREDRAQVFRQMISRSYKLSGMFDEGTVLQSKALVIDKQIRQYYNCAKGTLTWDKFIK